MFSVGCHNPNLSFIPKRIFLNSTLDINGRIVLRFPALIFLLFDFISLVALSRCFPFHPNNVSVHSASGRRKPSAAKQLCTEIAQKAAFISVAARPGGDDF